MSFSDTPSRGCIILLATYAETFGPSTVIISGKSPDITPALILSEYPPPFSLRGINSMSKKYFPSYFLLKSSTLFLYASPSGVFSIVCTHIEMYSSFLSKPLILPVSIFFSHPTKLIINMKINRILPIFFVI